MRAALFACTLAVAILCSVLTGLGLLLVESPRTIQADAVVLLSSGEPLTATVDRGGDKHTISLSDRPLIVSIPRIRFCSGTRFVWEPAPPPLVKLRVGIGTESYRLFTFGHGSSWFVENAETAVELSEGESAYRLDIGTITQRADGVWVLPVRLERRDSPREPVWEPPPQSAEARLA